MISGKVNNSLVLLAWAIFSALLLPSLVKDGMFLDGLVNSSMARNLAFGDGGFWTLHYTKAFSVPFYDQLPLAIGLQSIFFRIFGDHLFVDRLYSLLTAIVQAILIIQLWKFIYKGQEKLSKFSWLPMLLWIIIPVVSWSYSNNMLENTMGIFDCLSVILLLRVIEFPKYRFLYTAGAGMCILFAFLSKGPVGLFPLAIPFLIWFSFRNRNVNSMLIQTLVIVCTPVFLLLIMSAIEPQILETLKNYRDHQLIQSLSGSREANSNRFYIILRLFGELIPVLIFSSIVYFVSLKRKLVFQASPKLISFGKFFLLLALCGSIPILISPKQSGYYLVPALPYFALAFSVFIVERLELLFSNSDFMKQKSNYINRFAYLLFAAVLIFSTLQFGSEGRHKDKLQLVSVARNFISQKSTVSICPELMADWDLHAYLMRYLTVTLEPSNEQKIMIRSKECSTLVPEGYYEIETDLKNYVLYRKN